MNRLYLILALIGALNLIVVISNMIIIKKFGESKEIAGLFNSVYSVDQKIYKSIIAQDKIIVSLMESLDETHTALMQQYKEILDTNKTFVSICAECSSHYSDVYEQFKLCSDKLDRIIPPQVSVSPKDFEANWDDAPIGGFHDA